VILSDNGFDWGNKFTIPREITGHSPGFAFDPINDVTFIAWTGQDFSPQLPLVHDNPSRQLA